MKSPLINQRLDALEQRFQALREQAATLPGAREALEPALQEVAQGLAAMRAAQEAELRQRGEAWRDRVESLQQPEYSLGDSSTILQQIFEAIPDLLTVNDKDFNVILSNWRGHDFVTPEERQCQPKCYQVFLHQDRPCEPCIVREVLATGQPAKTVQYNPVDGQDREIHAFPILDKSGRSILVAKHIRNITALVRAETALREREELYRVLSERSLAGVYLIQDNKFIYVNPVLAQIFGYDMEEITNRLGPRDLIHPDDHQLLDERIRQRLSGEVDKTFSSLRGLRRDGTVIQIETLGRRVEYRGRPAIMGTLLDITERKQSERILASYAHFIKLLIDTIPNPVFYQDFQGIVIGCNKAFERFLRKSQREILGKTVYDLFPEDLAKKCDRADQEALMNPGTQLSVELRVPVTDGSQRQVISHKAAFSESPGGIGGVVSVITDVTELKQAEEALRESEERYRTLFETSPNACALMDLDMNITMTNQRALQLFGFGSLEEAMARNGLDYFAPADRPKVLALVKMVVKTGQIGPIGVSMIKLDGTPISCLISATLLRNVAGQPQAIIGVAQDITDLRRAEEAIRESEARLRAIFEYAPVGITMVDATGRFLQTNPAFQKIVGYDAAELQRMTFQQLTHPEDLSEDQALKEELLAGKRQYYSIEKRYLRKDGKLIWISAGLSRLLNAQGELRVVGTILDITSRKRSEKALVKSEQRFRLMAETIQDVFWISNPAIGETTYISPGYERVWGQAREAIYQDSQSFLKTIHPEDRERVISEIAEAQAQGISWSQEYRIIKPDSEVRWIQDRGFPVRDDQRQFVRYTGVATDITERKTLEAQLLLAQKMEAVGRLAGGVAHDFNNLLMAITGYGEIMRAKMLKDDPLFNYLEDILKTAERAAALTGQLLTFSRQQIMRPQVVDLNQVIMDLKGMLRRLIQEDIEIVIVNAPGLGMVHVDPGYLNQIIMNLMINARDAMSCGGSIIVETAEVDWDTSRQTRSGLAPPGAYVMLKISDSGIGIDESIQAHIFEPFFTTKESGKGTGLGLSTVYGIVKQSGGYIDLESKAGQGSAFTIYLPRLEAVAEVPQTKHPQMTRFQGKGTVLIVEDEDMLRTLLAKFLRFYGYTVLEARHGGEALLTSERHQGQIDLMVADMVMPKMSGRELADRLKPLRPEMKVLYMSGYTEDEVIQRGLADLSVSFLQKPFKPIDLAQQVYTVLNPPERD